MTDPHECGKPDMDSDDDGCMFRFEKVMTPRPTARLLSEHTATTYSQMFQRSQIIIGNTDTLRIFSFGKKIVYQKIELAHNITALK